MSSSGHPARGGPAMPAEQGREELLDTSEAQRRTIGALLKDKREPIAILGAGIRFPGGNENLDEFAAFLREGRSGIRPIPPDRWDVDAFGGDGAGKVRTVAGGFLDQIDQFDAQFFNISPQEAQWVDPQQRLLLEATWEALENANINPATLRHGNGGVYVGASSIDYALELDSLPYEQLHGHLASGITFYPMSGRLSYFLGWRGPSVSVDTACASSLNALHLAVQGLRRGECDIAVAAAVNCLHHPRIFVIFSEGNMLAPDGRCKTFDDSADGYARAEGCGAILLKRLSDAERDGDPILAVVRGTAIRQDGESAGLTVPNGTAQEIVIKAALDNAMLTPADIQYVEAHGTGTPLGDPIEMGAICDVFADSHTKADPVRVASLKTNVGHMEPAAGLGGVVKTILQMRDGLIYPHLNFRNPSGRIPWDRYPVAVPTECTPWVADTRRAVINSFGFAGAIAAAVLEQAPPVAAAPPAPVEEAGHVFTLSAKSRRALGLQLERYRAYLADGPEVPLGDLCYTGNVARSHFTHRVAGVVHDRDELAALLARHAEQVAAAVAGVFSLPDAVTLVATRGRLMQSVTAPGGMLAVPAPAEDVEPLLAGYPDLALAAVNSPQQCVVSGGRASLAAVGTLLAGRGLRGKELPVSHAFHSPLMAEVYGEFRAALAGITFREPRLTVISNLTGEMARPAELRDPEYWVRHIGAPVNFLAGMRTLERRGRHAFVEVGPSTALTSLARQCVTAATTAGCPASTPRTSGAARSGPRSPSCTPPAPRCPGPTSTPAGRTAGSRCPPTPSTASATGCR